MKTTRPALLPATLTAMIPGRLPAHPVPVIDATEQAPESTRWIYSQNPVDLARIALELCAAALPVRSNARATIPA